MINISNFCKIYLDPPQSINTETQRSEETAQMKNVEVIVNLMMETRKK